LNAEFAKWSKQKTARDILDFFEAMGVPCGVVKDVKELIEDPQLITRNMIIDVQHPMLGKVKTFNNPVLFLDAQTQVQPGENQLDPKIGEHTNSVLKRLLNINDSAIEELKKDEVIWI